MGFISAGYSAGVVAMLLKLRQIDKLWQDSSAPASELGDAEVFSEAEVDVESLRGSEPSPFPQDVVLSDGSGSDRNPGSSGMDWAPSHEMGGAPWASGDPADPIPSRTRGGSGVGQERPLSMPFQCSGATRSP